MRTLAQADTVVIGGGAIGTAVASYLARDGLDVALVEKGEFAWGSSRRCDGHVVTYDSPPGYFSILCRTGQEMFQEMARELDYDIEYEPEGLGLLVDNEADLDALSATYEGKKQEGTSVALWDQKELRHHEPHVADRVIACLNFTNDAKLNPMHLVFGLARHAQKNGAQLVTKTQVTGMRITNNQVTHVETDQGLIGCKRVIIAAGVWTPLIGDMAGVAIPIRPRQGMIIVHERVRNLIGKNYAEFGYLAAKGGKSRPGVTAAMEQFGVAAVLEPTAEGTVLAGSSRRFVGIDHQPHPVVIQAMAQRIAYFFPKFKDVRMLRTYAGVRPCSDDTVPIISPTHVGGLYVSSGHEGNGIGLSLISGKLTAQMLQAQKPLVDMAPLHIDRFALNPPALPAAQA